jgi:hypothetical protein
MSSRPTIADPSSRPSSLEVLFPFGAPSSRNLLPGQPFPADLAADFQIRFVPPSPFSTALTVCPSSNPVACFGHSHPWGFFSLRSRSCLWAPGQPAGPSRQGEWVLPQEAPGWLVLQAAEATRVAQATTPIAEAMVWLRTPSPFTVPRCSRPLARFHGRSSSGSSGTGLPQHRYRGGGPPWTTVFGPDSGLTFPAAFRPPVGVTTTDGRFHQGQTLAGLLALPPRLLSKAGCWRLPIFPPSLDRFSPKELAGQS